MTKFYKMIHKPRTVLCSTCGKRVHRIYFRIKQVWNPIGYFCENCKITGLDVETSIYELKPEVIYEGL